MASIRPLLDSREFDSNAEHIANVFVRDPELGACYKEVFKQPAEPSAVQIMVNVGKALAAYQETLSTGRTPFDAFRDSLADQTPQATPDFSASARRGLRLFVGSAGCISCHGGPNFSDGKFHAIPLPLRPNEPGVADSGRFEDASRLKASLLNLAGRFNDDARHRQTASVSELEVQDSMRGLFRTPSLRSIANTGPYMHDGRIERLQDAIQHGYLLQPNQPGLEPNTLAAQEVEDLYAFMLTLGDAHGENRPWSNTALATCPE